MSLLLALIHIAIVAAGAYCVGRCLLRFYWQFRHKAIQISAETAVGLAVLSFIIFLLGTLRQISKQNLLVLLLFVAVAAGIVLCRHLEILRPRSARRLLNVDAFSFFAIIALLLYFGWLSVSAALPPSDRDELIYHLEIPRQFLNHGGLVAFRDNIYGYFPQLGEMLFLFGLGTSGVAAAKLYHLLSGSLLATVLYGFSRRYVEKKDACGAVILFLSCPLALVTLPLAYVDYLFGLYAFLTLLCLMEFFRTDRLRWVILGGVFAGACLATKYTGIQVIILMVCMLLLEYLKARRKNRLLGALLLPSLAFSVALPYLCRNWAMTGWPIFPFSLAHLPLNPWINWDEERARLYLGWLGIYGAPIGGQTLWHVLLAPVLVFIFARFNEPVFYDGVLGIVFLMAPFLFAISRDRKPAEIKWLMVFSLLFLYYWAFTTRQSRFLIPVLPVLSFLIAYSLSRLKIKIAYAIVAALIAFNFWIGIRETCLKNPFPYWFGRETREQYLDRQWPGFAMYRQANKLLNRHDTVYLINMKNYLYNLDVPVRTDLVFERYSLDQVIRKDPAVPAIDRFFKHNHISHLMIDEAFVLSPDWGLRGKERMTFLDYLNSRAELLTRRGNFALYRLKTEIDPTP
jgi:hypothetical protein